MHACMDDGCLHVMRKESYRLYEVFMTLNMNNVSFILFSWTSVIELLMNPHINSMSFML